MPEAARRATIVAPAARPAYSPVHSSFRSIPGSLPDADSAKPEGYCNWVERETPRPKAERQRLIASVVTRRRIGSQLELAEALAKAGCPVTQATISRDIRELRLEKTTDALGRPRYVLPGRGRVSDPRKTLNGVLRQFGLRATPAQNIVVVQSELGSAPAIARALDQLGHAKIVGTLAGDDTCLVITRSLGDARSLARELGSALG
jgi:transcriptional regulator of arginine metabolism